MCAWGTWGYMGAQLRVVILMLWRRLGRGWRVVVESRLLWTGVPHVQSDRDKTFIQQVFYGCMRYSKVLKVRGTGEADVVALGQRWP